MDEDFSLAGGIGQKYKTGLWETENTLEIFFSLKGRKNRLSYMT